MDEFYRLLLGILCTWRVTHLIQAEDGPWDVIVRIRSAFNNNLLGHLMDCFYCLSLWVSLPLAFWIGQRISERVLLWLALSGGAILAERSTSSGRSQRALYIEHGEHKEN